MGPLPVVVVQPDESLHVAVSVHSGSPQNSGSLDELGEGKTNGQDPCGALCRVGVVR